MDWIGPSSNGLSKCKNNQAKFIWFTYIVHMVFTSRDWFQHYLSLFTLLQARKCWISKTLTLAGDMQWTNTPSSIIPLSNLNFSSLVFREKLNVRGFAKSRPAAQRPAAHGPRRPSGPRARRPIGPRPTAHDGPAARRPGGPAARWPSPDFPVFLSSGKSTRIQWTTVSLNSFTI